MTSKLNCAVLAAALALAAAPALAATPDCVLPVDPPRIGEVPPIPPLPSGVTEMMVLQCEPGPDQSAARLPAQCHQAPLAPYLAVLAERHTRVVQFRTALANWLSQANAYDACVLKIFG